MKEPKKSLGQNFLIDQNVINKIINKVNIKDENIVEIGPGYGSLTDHIIKKNPKLTCIVGLTTEPERLVDIRKNRMNLLKEKEVTTYTSFKKISKEVEEAKKIFKKYNWPTVDVTRKSVEETAASVIKIYEIEKEND